MRPLLALSVVVLVVAGSGAAAPLESGETPSQAVARSAEITRLAGSARFVVSYPGDFTWSGVIDLGNDTGVMDDRGIVSRDGSYHPLPKSEADALGIPEKRWFKADATKLVLGSDMFIPDTNAFFDLLGLAKDVRYVGMGSERGTEVRQYSAKLGIDAFLAVNAPTIEDTPTKSGPPVAIPMRDYFDGYFVWERGGQSLQLALDSQGRIRRAAVELPLEPLIIRLYDYGVAVDVSPPPAKQVISSAEYEHLKTVYCSAPSRQLQPRKAPCQ